MLLTVGSIGNSNYEVNIGNNILGYLYCYHGCCCPMYAKKEQLLILHNPIDLTKTFLAIGV